MGKKIAVLQIDSILGDQMATLAKIDSMLSDINDPEVRMAVFCEYGLSGFCTDLASVAKSIPGPITEEMEKLSKKHNIWLSGGLPELMPNGKVANSSVMISPKDGLVATYRKIHPFGGEREHVYFGDTPVVVDTEIGKVGLSICYDFIFPEFIRGLVLNGAEVILNSTFWYADDYSTPFGWCPDHTLALARVRALENKCFVAMACRTGCEDDGDNRMHGFGHSAIVDPMGNFIAKAGVGERVIIGEIDHQYREKCAGFGYINDRRPEIYKKMLDI